MRFAFCPRCGARLDTVAEGTDAGHPMCGACGVVHYDNPGVTAFAFVERDGRYLVLRREHEPHRGAWDLPGGFVESGEAPAEAVRRELHEETGLQAEALDLLGTYKSTYGAGRWTVDIAFRCVGRAGDVSLSAEKSDHRWVALGDMPPLAFEGERSALGDLRRLTDGRPLGSVRRGGGGLA